MKLKMTYTKYFFLWAFVGLLAACKPWDGYPENTSPDDYLFQRISAREELSRFAALLEETGYDDVLSAANTYTVWAPNNSALEEIDQDLLADTAWARNFVANHISKLRYATNDANPSIRIAQLNGKYVTFTSSYLNDAHILTANLNAANGLLHIIDQAIVPRLNIWEYSLSSTAGAKQAAYLHSLDYEGFDEGAAEQIGVDPSTGLPVYADGTGIVIRNRFLDSAADVRDEAKEHTFFVLADAVFDQGIDELSPFFAGVSADSVQQLSSWALAKDLAVTGIYEKDELPDSLVSTSGIKFPIDKEWIVDSYVASNGIVHILSSLPLHLPNKFAPIRIEGEEPVAFSRTDKEAETFYRIKPNPDGTVFRDIMVYGHSIAQFYIRYTAKDLPAATYRVYWRAVAGNDDSQTVSFTQRLAFGEWDNQSFFPYTTVELQHYNEVYLGDYTNEKFGDLNLYLVAANVATTGQNTLSLDYIRLVPVVQ